MQKNACTACMEFILPKTIGLILSINQLYILYSGIGEGFNEFNRKNGLMKIFRKGFPGKNSDVNIVYPLSDILREIYRTKCNKLNPDLIYKKFFKFLLTVNQKKAF